MMKTEIQAGALGLRAFEKWLVQVGVSRTTGWRWRRRGWIRTANISGKVYVTQSEIHRFTERVEAGNFAKEASVPKLHLERQTVGLASGSFTGRATARKPINTALAASEN